MEFLFVFTFEQVLCHIKWSGTKMPQLVHIVSCSWWRTGGESMWECSPPTTTCHIGELWRLLCHTMWHETYSLLFLSHSLWYIFDWILKVETFGTLVFRFYDVIEKMGFAFYSYIFLPIWFMWPVCSAHCGPKWSFLFLFCWVWCKNFWVAFNLCYNAEITKSLLKILNLNFKQQPIFFF